MNAACPNQQNLDRRASRFQSKLASLACAALATLVLAQPLYAEGLAGRFEVRSADLELKDGVYHLNARIDLPNSRVAELTQRYHLQYNAVSARYILRNDNSGQQESLGTVDEALEHLSEVHSLPALDKALIAPDRRYEANVRGKLDFGTVPFTMRLLMFWVSDWHRESDWYAWTFQP
jgi:hypothetical protein